MPSRLSFLFQMTTAPTDRSSATPHTGGWSESFWDAAELPSNDPSINRLATARAALLPKQASIIGFRIANYTLVGNKALPSGTSTSKRNWPGNVLYDCDQPQVGLEVSAKGPDGPNSARSVLRGIPDDQIAFGEYQPTQSFKTNFTTWADRVSKDNWWFLGRDLAQISTPVLSITADALAPPAPPTFVIAYQGAHNQAVGDYVRLNRCKDDAGNNVTGPFLVKELTINGIRVTGMPAGTILTHTSGTVRKDVVKVFLIREMAFARSVVRKIGRPFAGYRGRQSKR